jgi:hypothetical protein
MNSYGVESPTLSFKLRKISLGHTDSGDPAVANLNGEVSLVDVGNTLSMVIDSYRNFVDRNTSPEIQAIIDKSSYVISDFQNYLIEPNDCNTINKFLYSWQKAIQQIYTEVYCKSYAVSYLETTVTDGSNALKVDNAITVNQSLYNNAIASIEGKRIYKYLMTTVDGVSKLRWCEIADGIDDPSDPDFPKEFIIGETSELQNYGITVNVNVSSGSWFELTTAEKNIISLGKINPVSRIIDKEISSQMTLTYTAGELYSKYSNEKGYSTALLDLIIDLLERLI